MPPPIPDPSAHEPEVGQEHWEARATLPDGLEALAAGVTDCKIRHLHNGFLERQWFRESLDGGGREKSGWPEADSSAIGPGVERWCFKV